jgi:hypothetical protein
MEIKRHNYCNILNISMNWLFIARFWKNVLAILMVAQKLIGKIHGAISTTNVHRKRSTFAMVNLRCSIFGTSI